MRFKRFILPALLLSFLVVSFSFAVPRIQGEDELTEKEKEIQELEKKLAEVSGQKQTLAKTVSYLSTRISLTEKQVEQTEAEISTLETEIEVLSGKIDKLNVSLDSLTQILLNRINASYKTSFQDPIYLLLATDGFTNFFRRYKYLKVTQANDREVMFALENARTTFDSQRQVKQDKQNQVLELQSKLEGQKNSLVRQQADKQELLKITSNDEKKYQEMVARARAELQAIQAVIAGKGSESEVRSVSEGDKIASIISGRSPCSSGTHLHLEVVKNKSQINPFSMLKNISLIWDNSGQEMNGFGSWNWPLNESIRITQSYGKTPYSSIYAGDFHTGVDMVSTADLTVKAVKAGTLYRGSIACGGGSLKYVRVDHSDDDYDTYYLHVNY
jgi:peptidoglycan hydrolase CwlO-like protein